MSTTEPAGQAHGWKVASVFVLGGVIGYTVWQLAAIGWLDAAASALVLYIVGFAQKMLARGLIRMPEMIGKEVPDRPAEMTGHFKKVRWAALAVNEGLQSWLDASPAVRVALWQAVIVVLFLTARFGMKIALTAASNPLVIILATGTTVALVLSPAMYINVVNRVRTDKKPPNAEGGTT